MCLEIGQSCEFPHNVITGSHLIAQGAELTNATSQTIFAGGDNASRNMFVTAYNAALAGLDAIPSDWTSKALFYPRALKLAKQIVSYRND